MHTEKRLKKLFQHPLFLSGFIFLVLLVAASFIHAIFFHGKIPVTDFRYDSQGKMTGSGPFNPLEVPPLGTDEVGRHIFVLLLQGAKYTLGISILVAGLRVMISAIIGFLFGGFFSRIKPYVSRFVNGFYFIPTALLCYVLLFDVIMIPNYTADEYSFVLRAIYELIILTIVAIPTTSLLIGNQVDHIYKMEFITTAKTLGGSRIHLLRKHVLPYMIPRLFIQFTLEIVQVLVLLIHLGFFHLLFGGTIAKDLGDGQSAYLSVSSEWSGMVGNGFDHLSGWSWMFFDVIIAFTMVILALNFIVKGMNDIFLEERKMTKKNQIKKRPEEKNSSQIKQKLDFTLLICLMPLWHYL